MGGGAQAEGDIGSPQLGHAKAAGQCEVVHPREVLAVMLLSAQLGNGAAAQREVHLRSMGGGVASHSCRQDH